MATITLKGNEIHTVGDLPAVGTEAPNFTVTKTDLTDVSLKDFAGKKVILSIFPSIETSVCSAAEKKFNEEASSLNNVVILSISRDLPLAHNRFCEAEGIKNVIPTSEYKNTSFSDAYPVRILDGKFEGLFSRAVIVIDENGKVIYTEQVPEIGQEPDYESALNAVK